MGFCCCLFPPIASQTRVAHPSRFCEGSGMAKQLRGHGRYVTLNPSSPLFLSHFARRRAHHHRRFFLRRTGQFVTIQSKKCNERSNANAFIPINERMIFDQASTKRSGNRCHSRIIIVVDLVLRPHYRRFQKPSVTKPMRTAAPVDLLRMKHLDHFNGQKYPDHFASSRYVSSCCGRVRSNAAIASSALA